MILRSSFKDVESQTIDIAQILSVQALKDGAKLNVIYTPKPLHVIADPGQMESTLLNLILNANNAIKDTGTIEVRLLSKDHQASIVVRDDGRGMPANVRTKAIEPFFSTRTAEGGTGLGLSIVYGFIKQSGGNLEIDSKEGEGTTITISMPIAEQDRREIGDTCVKAALVIDDDQQVQWIVDSILCELKFKSTLCSSATEALEHLESGTFHLIVSDYDLGSDITGHDVLEVSAERLPEAKRILISGKSSLSDGYDGPNVMVQKPVTAEKIKFALEQESAGAIH